MIASVNGTVAVSVNHITIAGPFATAHYNNAILSDMFFAHHMQACMCVSHCIA